MSIEAFPQNKTTLRLNKEALAALLRENVTVFEHDFGTKQVVATWASRRSKTIKTIEDIKPYANYFIITGDGNIVDIDLDCEEALILAKYFLPDTGFKYGRESTPGSHWLYRVIDLNKKQTRKWFSFDDANVSKKTLVELRAHDHYSMASGKYPEDEYVKWNECSTIGETTYDPLLKKVAMLGVASIILRKYPKADRNVYVWKVAGALYHHKVTLEDAESIIDAVCEVAKDEEKNMRLAKLRSVYKPDGAEQIQGLPKLAEWQGWNEAQIRDFKNALYAVTGRSTLPTFTHEFVNRIAYMMKQKKFYDLEDKEMYDSEAIDVKYAKYFKDKYTPLKWWKMHPDSRVCVDFTYKPNEPKRFVHVSKKLMINVYEKHDLEPNPKADTDIFWALAKHVIPHEEYRNHIIDWMAYQVQNPGIKIRHALIMQSDEFQLGKGSLFDLHRDILGKHNTRKIELAEALDKGKNFLINYQTVLVDEAKSSGSWSEKAMLINTLKTLITEGSIGVRQLYKEYGEQDTCTNYWINTNYKDAFALPANEVRYFVYFSPSKRNNTMLEEFHHQRLSGELPAGVYADLLDRNLSKFNPLALAPHTPYRDEMSKLADRPLNDFVKEQFAQGVYPFNRELVTTVELFDWLRKESRIKVTREREVANALELIGGKCVKQVPIKSIGDRVTVWIINDHDAYKNLRGKELGGKYVPFYSDKRGGYNY